MESGRKGEMKMNRTYRKRTIILAIMILHFAVWFGQRYAVALNIRLVVNPNKTTVYAGSGRISIAIKGSEKNSQSH